MGFDGELAWNSFDEHYEGYCWTSGHDENDEDGGTVGVVVFVADCLLVVLVVAAASFRRYFERYSVRRRENLSGVNLSLAKYTQNACKFQIGPVDCVLLVFCKCFEGTLQAF